jgi:hypothetical protein
MRNNTNPAWRGGARQKVLFWSNGSADNRDLISESQACSRQQPGGQPGRVMIALSADNARAPLGIVATILCDPRVHW